MTTVPATHDTPSSETRRPMPRSLRVVAVLVLAVIAVAACGTRFDREGAIEELETSLGLDTTEAECVVDGMVDRYGEDTMATEDDPSPEQIQALIDFVDECSGGGVGLGSFDASANEAAGATVPFDGAIDDPDLAALADSCAAGDGAACDDVYWQSPVDSPLEAWARACGGQTNLTIPCEGRMAGEG